MELSMLDTSSTQSTPAHDRTAVEGPPGRRNQRWLPIAVLLAVSVTLVGGSAFLNAQSGAAAAVPAAPTMPLSFADLAEKVTPSVVTISSAHIVSGREEAFPAFPFDFPEGSPFEDFFRHFREQQRHDGSDRVMALGSGFIVDPSGYVVTNNHVVEQAEDIKVTLSNGTEYPANLVGTDGKTDIAVLKIKASVPLPAVSFGDSDKVRVGDWVMAVGNPFGFGGTVTSGIISARGRDLQSGPFDDFLQIDAAINQGNSGGPTFNLAGEVVGINTAIASPNGGSVGIGFDIPANLAKPVIAQLESHGSVERGWLGVAIQPVTPEIAAAIGLDEAGGALVGQVEPNSPAAGGGLRQGDVITGYNGHRIADVRDLTRLVADTPPGKTVALEVWRDRSRVSLDAEIANLAPEQQAAIVEEGSGSGEGTAITSLGATLAPITPETRAEMDIPDDITGVIITGVEENGSVAEQGLRPGDVIEQVGQRQVRTPEDVGAIVAAATAAKQTAILLLVNREGAEVFVAVKVGHASPHSPA
jgi:serine protease Do